MFTGLVETVGTIAEVRSFGEVTRLVIESRRLAPALVFGQSVCVSGACLSVVDVRETLFEAEMMPETRDRTTLGQRRKGDRVNLERALTMGARLDGHFVSGHVDGMGDVLRLSGEGRTKLLEISVEEALLREIVPKGSIAVDGVSLTVIDVLPKSFSVGLIPTTLGETTLAALRSGDWVNLETDMLGKYVRRTLEGFLTGNGEEKRRQTEGITWDRLREYGWT
ncbi:riboflavin synthase [Aminiphilus circumscriptus]|jgi:riboflavin synthase|uniref:riboflavin synthase n=1 Tax=Aminiphilus circumscriptus TaxID=290732 RepID=UPI00049242E2|nr:riboflavin synthase [Aminiphilus circumscriptus]